MKKNILRMALAVVFWFASAALSAAEFDGSKALVCATVDAHACDPGEICLRELPAELGVPQFLHIDFAKKTISGPKSTTPIRYMDKGADQLLLQGTELGYAWSLVLDKTDGSMAFTLVNREDVFVAFGYCIPP